MIILNKQYGNWTVIKQIESKNGKSYYFCRCKCGQEKDVRGSDLRKAQSQFCQSCRFKDKEIKIGDKFQKWTVIKEVPTLDKRKAFYVECECGNVTIIKAIRLRFGDSKGCRKCGSTKHGMVHSGTYSTWENMIQRTTNPKHDKFHYYGGRGITVCERWKIFENFYADMGERPRGYEIDRINNDGNYEPNNCQWISKSDNLKRQARYQIKS